MSIDLHHLKRASRQVLRIVVPFRENLYEKNPATALNPKPSIHWGCFLGSGGSSVLSFDWKVPEILRFLSS